ncbi:hypothetical protein DES36_12231 [Alkalibaculum bacchi]|uniref:Uncharacterized protein n=1 Tax=Alkalibaculum bacchi TaxID=645887 RepID=A0A366HXV7_9FIRM|nr:hypothetical protein [Alkalibaculum bacchi]RBP58606.1 hypothetical protein DES36_12231 [Alkalibaculum bacchi]
MDKHTERKKSEEFKEAMRDKTVGEFLNDQLYEHGITNKGDMLSQDNTDYYLKENENKNKINK